MADKTLFSKIIDGDLPGRFVYADDRAVAFLTINPLAPGHTLVVPREPIDHWIDLPDDLAAHLMVVAKTVSHAIQAGFSPAKVALMIAGLEVPHVHLHVSPIHALGDMDFANADPDPSPASLDEAAATIRQELAVLGCEHVAE